MPDHYGRIKTENYSYCLPEESIAKYPLPQRDMSKLLVYRHGTINNDMFCNLPDHLDPGHLLVCNDTRVIQARLIFTKPGGAKIEIFCLEPEKPSDYAQSFASTGACCWRCLVGNLKKWKQPAISTTFLYNGKDCVLKAERLETDRENSIVRFSWSPDKLSFADVLDSKGITPIPPYLNRPAEISDKTGYQTVYSKFDGSVAAPTAGLHFTRKVLLDAEEKGIHLANVTLHVGAGTFRPVQSETTGGHTMHTEHFIIGKECIEQLIEHRGKVMAVGTTSLRTLESIYLTGIKLLNSMAEPFHIKQWESYGSKDVPFEMALNAVLGHFGSTGQENLDATTQIMIVPGYRFRVVNGLITNFHLPKSTLILLVAAFIGDDWRKVYDHALRNNYRFLSYGDSSLLLP